jgi:DNA-binding MarR family transcriptional regulator
MPSAESTTRTQAGESLTVRTFRELIRTIGLLERVMQPHFARFGITSSQWGVLRTLHRAANEGAPGLRMTDLGERLLIRPPSVTGVVDRLERAGLVERKASPDDQRAKLVGLTGAGRQLVQRVLTVHEAQVEAALAGLDLAEQVALHRHLGRLGRHLEELLARGPVVQPESA